MTKKFYQVHIGLMEAKPEIWRSILIPSDILLKNFHLVIQVAMGWHNSHQHQFVYQEVFYGEPDDEMWGDMEDYSNVKLSDLLKKEEDSLMYEYDFGDGWMHQVVLEKVLTEPGVSHIPFCLKGKGNCPPEDCGGFFGYANMLEILKDPEHDDYEEYADWVGDDFDPEYFNLEKTNTRLHRIKYFSS